MFGKSLTFLIASVVHAELPKFNNTFVAKAVVIVISPLESLIGDKKNSLQAFRIKTGSVGKDNLPIENGECSVTFTSLEYQLQNGRSRSMLSSEVYTKNFIGIVAYE